MPKKNGIDASKEILKIDANVKIIFTTADNSINEDTRSNRAFSFKDKPFTIEQLIDDINKVLNSS